MNNDKSAIQVIAGAARCPEYSPSMVKVYTLTLTDANNLNIDLEALTASGISVTRSGNSYTFTSKEMLESPVALQFRKNVPIGEAMLIWGREGWQTMMTGAKDPVSFYMQIKTETYGKAKIVKTSEDGIVEGIPFTISGNGVEESVVTGADGTVSLDLLPGTYLVTEQPIDRYVTPAAQYITIESGQTASVQFSNILKKFRVEGHKVDAETGEAQGDASLAGAVYGLYKGGELVDTFTTGPDGSFATGYYPCGDDWTLQEISPSPGYLLDETVHKVGASPSLYEIELNTTENTLPETVIRGNIQLVKHMPSAELKEMLYLLNTANLDSYGFHHPEVHVVESGPVAFCGWLDQRYARPYRTEVQLYKSLLALKRSIDRDCIVTSQREALQMLRCVISNLEYRFYKAYNMEFEDKRTVYSECAFRLIPREDEPSVCLMHDWVYLPTA